MFKFILGFAAGIVIANMNASRRTQITQNAMQAALDQWSRSTHAALESQYTPELPTEPPPEVVMLGRGGRRYGMGSRDPLGNRQGFGRLMPGHAPIL